MVSSFITFPLIVSSCASQRSAVEAFFVPGVGRDFSVVEVGESALLSPAPGPGGNRACRKPTFDAKAVRPQARKGRSAGGCGEPWRSRK